MRTLNSGCPYSTGAPFFTKTSKISPEHSARTSFITFIASDPISRVYVNGAELSAEHYTLDGKNVTLKASYLNTLKADAAYTITVTVTNNGNSADVSSSFKILSGGPGGSSGAAPQTGDGEVYLWAALLLFSVGGCALLLPRLRRE